MFSYFFAHIRTHKARTFAIFLVALVILSVAMSALYIYKNTENLVTYFSYSIVDSSRFTIMSSSNVVDLFTHGENGLDEALVTKILDDSRLDKVQVFRLVDIPVTASMSFFGFNFESDVPVFSVTDGILTGAEIPVGLSQMIVDFYNTQFAGSSEYFPRMSGIFLKGQKIQFTFGESKIFASLPHQSEAFTGTITEIRGDFPGFGMVLPESIVQKALRDTGYSLRSPYKIIAYMRNPDERAVIEQSYAPYTLNFDEDSQKKLQKQLQGIQYVIGSVVGIVTGIMLFFFFFLLSGYFRERRDIFRMISIFGLNSPRSYALTLGEPLAIIASSIFLGGIFLFFIENSLNAYFLAFLTDYGFSQIVLIELSIGDMILIGLLLFLIFAFMVIFFEWQERRKYIFR